MSIFDVQHQARAQRMIQRALSCERMPHAYLFAGPGGVGKDMLARRLAKVLLCGSRVERRMPEGISEGPSKAFDACGGCDDCRLVDAGTHPDLFLIYRQLNRQHPESRIRKQKALFLSVDVVRHFLIDRSGTRPNRGRAKVFIVQEAERLNESAQNSLLKTLEEPPRDTFIILVTEAMDRMLPTTRSRCQQVSFQSLPAAFVAESVRRLRPDVNDVDAKYVSHHANGSLGGALRDLDDGLVGLKREWADRLMQLLAGGRGIAPNEMAKPFMSDAKSLAKCAMHRDPDMSETDATRVGLQSLLSALGDLYLDALRRRVGADLPAINADQIGLVERLSSDLGERALRQSLRHLAEADANLGRNAHIELTLEALFIRLAQTKRLQKS